MDVSPATIEQVRIARDGRVVTFSVADSQVAADLHRIGTEVVGTPFLLRWHEETDHWSVVQKYGPAEDDEQLVATCQVKDELPLLVQDLERKINRDWDLAAELNAADDASDKARQHEFDELVSDVAQRAWHDFRRKAGATDRIFVPGR